MSFGKMGLGYLTNLKEAGVYTTERQILFSTAHSFRRATIGTLQYF
jgi:hypothetical protein